MYCAQWVCTSLRCCKIYLCFIWDTTISTNSHNRTCVVVVLLQFSKCVWGCSWRGYTIIETKLSFTDNKSVWCNCNCGIRRRGLPWDGHWCAVDKGDLNIGRRCWNWHTCTEADCKYDIPQQKFVAADSMVYLHRAITVYLLYRNLHLHLDTTFNCCFSGIRTYNAV